MNAITIFQNALEETFPSLTIFSDVNWPEITHEFIASHKENPKSIEEFRANFPLFLQQKAEMGDCPDYLFELAFFELAQEQILASSYELPTSPGLFLNPSATFLNLDYDVNLMLEEATKGSVKIFERSHILSLYRHPEFGLMQKELSHDEIKILGQIEAGEEISEEQLKDLKEAGLVIQN